MAGNMVQQLKKEKVSNSIAKRLKRIRSKVALGAGEHPLDLCVYGNNTTVTQVITDMLGQRFELLPSQFTKKSMRMWERTRTKEKPNGDQSLLVPFPGGTIVLTREAAMDLVNMNKIRFLAVENAFDPETDEDFDR